MMDTLATYIAANRCYPFDEFFELLQGQGFSFGVDTFETAHYLIINAIASGNLERLDMWLCPVLAHSAEQQAIFLELYKRLFIPFLEQQSEAVGKGIKPPTPEAESDTATTERSARQIQKEADEKNEKIVASLKSRSSGSHMIERFVQSTEIESDPVLLRVVRQLRCTEHSGRYSFDIEKTIHQTIYEGGLARPVYTADRRHIEYLMLIDRHNSRDHKARLHNNLYETLKANNIFVERFFFDKSPFICRNHQHPSGITLTEILSLYEHSALMIFTDGLQFIDTFDLKLFAWADIFKYWQHRYFFSSISPALWGKYERLLQGVFPFVLPLSLDGVQLMAADLLSDAGTDFDCIHYWSDNADYSLVPVQTEGKKLDDIGLFFDDQLKRWIAACAIYPELDWNLTLGLGKLFSTEKNILPSYKNISQLLRLNWFTKGRIPDAFRLDLVQQWLNHQDRASVYQFLYEQLSQNLPLQNEPDYENRRLQLDIYSLLGEPDEKKFNKNADKLFEVLKLQKSRTDMVSLQVIKGRDNSRLFFEIPEYILQRWGIASEKKNINIEQMIRMLDNPVTIGDALLEAAKLPFRGDDKFRFVQKRQRYIEGLSDHERHRWVYDMKGLLSLYDGSTSSAERAETPTREQRNEFKTDIFISYARKDLKRVEPIVRELQKYGWSVFHDMEIPPGVNWRSYFKKRLDESRCVIVAWSHLSINSNWVIAEADEADKRGILVPVLLDAVEPPFGFSHIQAADLSDWNNDDPKFLQFIEAIENIIAQPVEYSSKNSYIIPLRNFILIRGATFTMGSPKNEVGRSSDETQHWVKVSEFYLSKYAVTLAEFKKFIDESGYQTDAEKENSSFIWDEKEWKDKEGINWRHGVSGNERAPEEDNHPVLHVSWNDAVAYCKWMSDKTGKSLRLPTEAEWEYACRAGTTTPFNTGENLTTDQANYDGNYPYNNNKPGKYLKNTVAVDGYAPNAWGLYNMHGNVSEWCSDWYGGKYYDECKAKDIVENPAGSETGSNRVLRGGYWCSYARNCRSAYRDYDTPDHRSNFVGFRLVFVPLSVGSSFRPLL
ncbi:MAG: SUMF1/EgtB/PvdO family nonheme iron enzyme [Chlorobium sp.]